MSSDDAINAMARKAVLVLAAREQLLSAENSLTQVQLSYSNSETGKLALIAAARERLKRIRASLVPFEDVK